MGFGAPARLVVGIGRIGSGPRTSSSYGGLQCGFYRAPPNGITIFTTVPRCLENGPCDFMLVGLMPLMDCASTGSSLMLTTTMLPLTMSLIGSLVAIAVNFACAVVIAMRVLAVQHVIMA